MKLNNIYREKLLNAILYFSKNVKLPSKLKIFKLLYFLDFRHYKETGQNVTNLDYYALDFGPVPLDLYNEVKDNQVPDDFSDFLVIEPFKAEFSEKSGGMFKAKAKARLNISVFTPREQRIMKELVDIYRDVDAKMISDVSHFRNHPWDKTIKDKGKNKKIEYSLAIDKDSKIDATYASDLMTDRDEILRAFPLKNRI
ncbi:MAG: Panacea domain-containing protein [Ignavibacteria bacterium]|jgi:uncharacterized phage-associated protein